MQMEETRAQGIMHKIFLFSVKTAGVLFIVFSSCLLLCAVQKWSYIMQETQYAGIGMMQCVLFFAVIINCSRDAAKRNWKSDVLNVFLTSLSIRLLLALLIGQDIEQVSDFQVALDTSSKVFPLNEVLLGYRVFSNWAIYPLYLKLVQTLFGYGVFTGIAANAVICTASSMLVYILCHIWVKNDKIGYMAAMIYTFWPSHLLYIVVLSPEFLNIVCVLLFLLFLKITVNCYEKCEPFAVQCIWGGGNRGDFIVSWVL